MNGRIDRFASTNGGRVGEAKRASARAATLRRGRERLGGGGRGDVAAFGRFVDVVEELSVARAGKTRERRRGRREPAAARRAKRRPRQSRDGDEGGRERGGEDH